MMTLGRLEKRIALWATIIASTVGVIVAVVSLIPPTNPPPPPDPFAANKAAYKTAKRAEQEPTFRDARNVLAQVDMRALNDLDLTELVDYELRVSNVCIELNIKKDTGTDIRDILANLDLKAITAALLEKGVATVPERAQDIFAEVTSLYLKLDRFEEIETTLRNRYGA